ncbi:hypothetical protein Barb6XT_02567 [Bacteroidales bacterium Barb6XT]|nr:hypothetical protein Barb6XT_02567 [Bacteroidales bacterium Barb6XT]
MSLTGFDVTEFEAFLPTFKYHGEEYHPHFTLTGKIKERKLIIVKQVTPLIEDKLLFILSYLGIANEGYLAFHFDNALIIILIFPAFLLSWNSIQTFFLFLPKSA